MTKPSPASLRACATAAAHMADRTTPLILNEWYVAAFTAELGRTLTERKLLGRSVVLYRTRDGRPVALETAVPIDPSPYPPADWTATPLSAAITASGTIRPATASRFPPRRSAPRGSGCARTL